MTESDIDHLIEAMPGGPSGFKISWTLRQFAHAVHHFVLAQNKSNWVDCWIDSRIVPHSPKGEHFSVPVLAVVDDPSLRLNGELPFIDIAAYWPALKKWTVTCYECNKIAHQCVADEVVTDYEVRVTKWMPLPSIKD